MTTDIRNLRNRKFSSPLTDPFHIHLHSIAIVSIILAFCGYVLVLACLIFIPGVKSLYLSYLIASCSGALIMSIACLVLRGKVKEMHIYQEQMVQAVYDSLELFQNCIKEQQNQNKEILSRIDAINIQSNHSQDSTDGHNHDENE